MDLHHTIIISDYLLIFVSTFFIFSFGWLFSLQTSYTFSIQLSDRFEWPEQTPFETHATWYRSLASEFQLSVMESVLFPFSAWMWRDLDL